MSTSFESVQHLLVKPGRPPRQIGALDPEHCAGLHSAILEHGWLSSGRSPGDLQSQRTPYHDRTVGVIDEKFNECSLTSLLW